MTSALDLFADEGLRYAQRLMQTGVPVELHIYPGVFPGFGFGFGFGFAGRITIGLAALDSSLSALRRALGKSGAAA